MKKAYKHAVQKAFIVTWTNIHIFEEVTPLNNITLGLTTAMLEEEEHLVAKAALTLMQKQGPGLLHIDLDSFNKEERIIILELAACETIGSLVDKALDMLPSNDKSEDKFLKLYEKFYDYLHSNYKKGEHIELEKATKKFLKK